MIEFIKADRNIASVFASLLAGFVSLHFIGPFGLKENQSDANMFDYCYCILYMERFAIFVHFESNGIEKNEDFFLSTSNDQGCNYR